MILYPLSHIRIEGAYTVGTLLKFKLYSKVNNHGVVSYSGLISKEQVSKILRQSDNNKIKIFIAGQLEFCGYVDDFGILADKTDSYILNVSGVGFSKKLDIDEHKRFFQNTERSYQDIIQEAYNDSDTEGSLIGSRGKQPINSPVLQYCETDWNYTLRMAGLNNTVVIPNILSDFPDVCFGMPARKTSSVEESLTRRRCRRDEFLPKPVTVSNENRNMSIVFLTKDSNSNYSLGDCVFVDGKDLYVVSKEWVQQQEYISPQYILAAHEAVSIPIHKNKNISGLELEGTVLSVKPTTLKVKLDIDRGRRYSENCWFSFAPNTNNAMYSMPLKDEKVTLQWQSEEDADILITRSVRHMDQQLGPPNKYFQNEFPSHMSMVPSTLSFKSPINHVSLTQGSGANFTSQGYVKMGASKNITISAPVIKIESPEQVTVTNNQGTVRHNSIWMGIREIHITSDIVNVESEVNGEKIMPPAFVANPFIIATSKALKIIANQPSKTSAK